LHLIICVTKENYLASGSSHATVARVVDAALRTSLDADQCFKAGDIVFDYSAGVVIRAIVRN
jgi:hypothetical protein